MHLLALRFVMVKSPGWNDEVGVSRSVEPSGSFCRFSTWSTRRPSVWASGDWEKERGRYL